MTDKRPVNLDIATIRMPAAAIASILHRVSGVVLVGALVLLVWALKKSLISEYSFMEIKLLLSGFFPKFVLFGILAALMYHLVAGVRHLFMDMGIGETREGGQLGAKVALFLSIVLIVVTGAWLWIA